MLLHLDLSGEANSLLLGSVLLDAEDFQGPSYSSTFGGEYKSSYSADSGAVESADMGMLSLNSPTRIPVANSTPIEKVEYKSSQSERKQQASYEQMKRTTQSLKQSFVLLYREIKRLQNFGVLNCSALTKVNLNNHPEWINPILFTFMITLTYLYVTS